MGLFMGITRGIRYAGTGTQREIVAWRLGVSLPLLDEPPALGEPPELAELGATEHFDPSPR